jgi:hypothetical protein
MRALHFAFLDPYNLGALSFKMLRSLASIQFDDASSTDARD